MSATPPHDQPVGPSLGDWSPPGELSGERLTGRTVALVPQVPERDAALLHPHFVGADHLWTYLSWGPFDTPSDLEVTLEWIADRPDWRGYTLMVDGAAVGMCSFLRVDPRNGSAEIGGITWSPRLQRTTASTEAIALMIGHCFDRGYRRVEWKCDHLNAASRAAAERFGFGYEGTFRKATHYKGRSRDTAWFAIVDDDWPAIRTAFDRWLDPTNFDSDGNQVRSLRSLRADAG